MAKKKKEMGEDQIVAVLDQHILFTTGYADSNLTKERTKVLEYYDGQLPAPTSKGNSKFVQQDVFEAVESTKATLLEAFSTNDAPVRYDPEGASDVELARIATTYCSYIVYRQNDGYGVMGEVLEDGLLARVGIAQYSWEEEEEEDEQEIGPATLDQLAAHPFIQDDKTEIDGLDDHLDGTYTAKARKRTTKGRVVLEAVEPEDFGITSRAKNLKKAKLCYRRKAYTKGELLEEGYDEKLIDELPADTNELQLDQEKAARFRLLEDQRLQTDDTIDLTDGYKAFTIYHCYARIDIERTGIPKLWHIVKCGHIILKKEKVRNAPFAVFVPIPKAHSFHGSNFAMKVVPMQNARTVLTRVILDHSVITNAPRWTVLKGGLTNSRELMDNRVGGLVNITRPDAVKPLEQAPLNPFVFQTLQLLDQSKETITGVSSLSKGLNRDAISNQNSQGLVEDLVSLSERRQRIIGRQFAEFLKDLWLGIYQLVLDHQDYEDEIEVAGNFIKVDPRKWRERKLVTATINIGYDEQEKEADKWVKIDTYMKAPDLQPMYTPPKRYNVIRRAIEAMGIKDVDNVIVPIQQQQPPQPDPAHMAEVQLKQAQAQAQSAQAQAQLMTARAAVLRTQFESNKWRGEMLVKMHEMQANDALKADAQTLKERMQLHREAVDAAEIELQKIEIQNADKQAANALLAPKG